MKRCPECGREYDNTMTFCLDDGSELLYGPASIDGPGLAFSSAEPPTAHFSEAPTLADPGQTAVKPTNGTNADEGALPWQHKRFIPILALVVSAVVVIIGGLYWLKTPAAVEKKGVSQAAYDNYMRARVLVTNENKEDNEVAIKLLEKTVNEEPQYGAAWATLARAYNVRAFFYAPPEERKQLNDNAKVAVEKAFAIDPNLADAHLSRGLLLWSHASRFQHEQAIQSYRRAIELDPKLDEAHHQLALVYFHIGLFDKAEAEIGKALEINPANSLARYRYAVINMYRGKYDDAYKISQSTPLENNPALHESQGAMILFRLGRLDEAERTIDAYLSKYPNDEGGIATSVKAMILAKRGRVDDAISAINRAEELGKDFGHFHHTAYNIACVYVVLGKPDKAVNYLQMAADDGFPCYPLFERDELLKDISHEPRFIELLARMKEQWGRYNATL